MEHLFHPVRYFTSVIDYLICIHHILCLRSYARQFASSQFITKPNTCLCTGARLTHPTKCSEILDNAVNLESEAGRGFRSFLVWKSFKGNLIKLRKGQKNPDICGHVRMLSRFLSLIISL